MSLLESPAGRRPHAAVAAAAVIVLLALAVIGLGPLKGSWLHPCEVGGFRAECGSFTVREVPANPDSRTLHLRVVVLKATSRKRLGDPLFWFAGWGGAGASEDAPGVVQYLRRVNEQRDLVFIDQRGTGSSRLGCAVPSAPKLTAAGLTAAARRCAAKIGPGLRYYTSAVAVDDVDRVRQKLGYQRINLYGGSYGATTAQIYLLRHRSHVRSVVLDSGSLLDVHIFERSARGVQRALGFIFRRCARDTACSTAFPHLPQELRSLMKELAQRPITIPGLGEQLTPTTLGAAIGELVAFAGGKAETPLFIHLLATGKIREAAALARRNIGPQRTELAYQVLIECSEPWASRRLAQIAQLSAGTITGRFQLRNALQMQAVCRGLPRAPVPASIGRRVRSNVPVLILTGNEDPADPPANVAHARRELPNSATVIFPNSGHGQLGLLCAQNLIADFVAHPVPAALDSLCARTAIRSEFDLGQ